MTERLKAEARRKRPLATVVIGGLKIDPQLPLCYYARGDGCLENI